ncbi:E3 ubiquitin ligase [Klebsormidium nitens]|uniref:RING-type E3 ubiquitin transferase n=1 Tax=Klebsormidium nitens TaxID=105231 RepID=A0A0U9HJJ9_KLENI|nr:E3 ubiquitin ligase [Klebsormidium nitens]|eukprot:GAQ81970.1 E3 ubiquitin ligase [Klebsormidium nitens]
MKFGSQFQWFLQSQISGEYRAHCLQYKSLKKQLSPCRRRDPSAPPPHGSPSVWDSYRPVRAHCDSCDVHFWSNVGKEVKDISAFFTKRAAFLLQEHGVSPVYDAQHRWFACFLGDGCRGHAHEQVVDAELAGEARQLIQFAKANTMALRKILKKYDKLHRTGAGKEFMQRLLRKEHGNSFFTQRFLLHELTALHSSLGEEKTSDAAIGREQRHKCAELLQAVRLSLTDAGTEARLPGPYALDLHCSVCLEVFVDPMGLKCGHVFCKSCACRVARIHPLNPKGLKVALKTARCAICRQADVYQKAVPLPEVGELVKKRFPKEWKERELQDRQILPYKADSRLDGYIQAPQRAL